MKRTVTNQMRQSRGRLLRLERDLGRVTRDADGANRRRTVGGATILIGLLALVGALIGGNQFIIVIATAGLFIGGLVFIKALMKMGGARRSMKTITDRVTNEQATMTGLEAQPSIAE